MLAESTTRPAAERPLASPPEIQLCDAQGRTYACPQGQTLTIGRPNAQAPPSIAVEDPRVSRTHCEVVAVPGGLRVVDRSSFGTFVNGARIDGEALVQPGDQLRLGEAWVFTLGGASELLAASQLPERLLERYRVGEVIGTGAAGVVYQGVDEQSGEAVAIKLLKGSRAKPEQVKRFQREVELGKLLGAHEGIVQVRDSGALPSGELFCVMDFVDGYPLSKWIVGGLTLEQALPLVVSTARAVAFAHEHNVIHRDLKPQNVLITPAGEARLTDFGIAKALDDLEGLTATGAVMGTMTYMPPEQVEDSKRVDARSDVYGLGAILYAVLTSRPPLDLRGLNMRQSLKKVLEHEVQAPREFVPELDASLDAICMKSLAREPDARYPNAGAFADALEAWLKGDRTQPSSPPPPAPDLDEDDEEPAAGRALAAILLFGVVVLALLAFALGRP